MIVPRRGRGGETVFDVARLQTPSASALLLVAFRSPLYPKDVLTAKEQLRTIGDDLRLRRQASYLPVLATDVASRSVVDACEREGVGIIDRRGTIIVHEGPVYLHVVGRAPVDRTTRVRLFSGKACRIVRFLLHHPGQKLKAQEVATGTQTSYAFTQGVLTRLERDGLVARASPRSGFTLRDGAALLKAWVGSGERSAARATPYFAPNTRPERLAEAAAASRASGVKSVFTLASAFLPDEVFVSGLPHGAYVSGDVTAFEEKLALERSTPHNFFILRPEPAAETAAGGVYGFTRDVQAGVAVALPQLAADFATIGGRGREQADRLIELYAKGLPPPELPP